MTDLKFHAYSPRGPVALLPSAYGQEFPAGAAALNYELCGRAAVVRINGPLTMAGAPVCDTYDSIVSRVSAALESEAELVILRINSPGGDVFGCFDCARALRSKAKAAGKRLVSFSEANMCSSAYAIGSAGDEIVISDTASIGSIGVIATAMDLTKQDAAMGISVALVTSGSHKADSNPHTPFTAEMRDAMQVSVDAMASVFFEHVGSMRGDRLSAKAAQALEAGVAVGNEAVAAGLADRISSWDQLISSLEAPPVQQIENAILPKAMAEPEKDKDEKKEDAVRASLVTASESDDPKKAARAKSALKAYDDGEDEKAEAPEDDKKAVAAASSDDDEKKALKATVSALSASVKQMQAEQQATAQAKAASERSAFLASRPDLTKEQLEAFAPLSLAQVKAIVATLPPPREFVNPYVASVAASVIGDPAQVSYLSPSAQAELDAQMGISAPAPLGTRMNGVVQEFGVPVKASK